MKDYIEVPLKNAIVKAIISPQDEEKIKKGAEYWIFDSDGYARSNDLRLMHRFILNAPKNMHTHHKNSCRLDNRRENIELVSQIQHNMLEPSRRKHSKYKGVTWSKKANKWEVGFTKNRKYHYGGCFNSEEEAAQAAINLFEKLWGFKMPSVNICIGNINIIQGKD